MQLGNVALKSAKEFLCLKSFVSGYFWELGNKSQSASWEPWVMKPPTQNPHVVLAKEATEQACLVGCDV